MTELPPLENPKEHLVSVASAVQGFAGRHRREVVPPIEKIVVRHLDFFYGSARALIDNNVVFYDKSVTALIGPSGCGKSTLLRVLNRIYGLYPGHRARGEVLVDGENILDPSVDLNRLRARIGMVFQKPTPFPMSIYENVAFGIGLYEASRDPRSMSGSRRRCGGRACGTRSRIFFIRAGFRCRAASSSGFALRVRSRSIPRSFFSTSRARRSIRCRPIASSSSSTSCARIIASSSSPTTCSRQRASRIAPPSCISARSSNATRPKRFSPVRRSMRPRPM